MVLFQDRHITYYYFSDIFFPHIGGSKQLSPRRSLAFSLEKEEVGPLFLDTTKMSQFWKYYGL